jgi:hypothetical protein
MNDQVPIVVHTVKSVKVELERTENGSLVLKHTFRPSVDSEGKPTDQTHTLSYFTQGSPTYEDESGMVAILNSVRQEMSRECEYAASLYRHRMRDVVVAASIAPTNDCLSITQLESLWASGVGSEVLAVFEGKVFDLSNTTPKTIDTIGRGFLGYRVRDFEPLDGIDTSLRNRMRELLQYLMFYKIPEGTLKTVQPYWM